MVVSRLSSDAQNLPDDPAVLKAMIAALQAENATISATLRDVLMRSEQTRRGIVLVIDDQERLLGVVTDGDIRRAFLAGWSR